MASIAEWIEKIKTAIYGEEVRGAIWQSLEAMNTEVEAINVDEEQIEQNKQNIATNTAAITTLNSRILGYIGKETLTNSTVYSAYGWITGGKKTLLLMIPLNLTNELSTATFTSLKVGLRLSSGGYAFGADNTDVTSKITKTVVNKREGVLRVEITSDTDICETNNICCAGTANFTATFS